MGNRETQELEKAVAKFLRKLEAGKKDKERTENRENPPGKNTSPKADCGVYRGVLEE